MRWRAGRGYGGEGTEKQKQIVRGRIKRWLLSWTGLREFLAHTRRCVVVNAMFRLTKVRANAAKLIRKELLIGLPRSPGFQPIDQACAPALSMIASGRARRSILECFSQMTGVRTGPLSSLPLLSYAHARAYTHREKSEEE